MRGFGATEAAAFENAARALTAVLVDPGKVAPRERQRIVCEAPDREMLLVDWLNALVFEMATCELENAYVLLYDKKLSSLRPLISLLEAVVQQGTPLLIIAEDVTDEALSTLMVNKLRGGMKVAAVKAPGFGDRRRAILEDIAVLTGGQLMSEELGIHLENVQIDQLGRANRVVCTREDTTIVGGAGAKADIDARIQQIRAQIEDTTSDYDREKLEERLASSRAVSRSFASVPRPRRRRRAGRKRSMTPSTRRRPLSRRASCLAAV